MSSVWRPPPGRESRAEAERPPKQNFTELYMRIEKESLRKPRQWREKVHFDRSLGHTSHSERGGKDFRSHRVEKKFDEGFEQQHRETADAEGPTADGSRERRSSRSQWGVQH